MALITQYSELKTEIANYIDYDSLTADIPLFIQLAETEIKSDLDLVDSQAIATADTSTSSQYLALPSYFSSSIRMHINVTDSNGNVEQYPVTFTTAEGLNSYYTSTAQRPRYVAIVDGQLEFNCVPDDAYEIEFLYNKLTSLDGTTNTTNELFPTFLNCYLYGALKHAALFVQEDETNYERQYEVFIKKIKRQNKKKKFPAPLRPNTRYSK